MPLPTTRAARYDYRRKKYAKKMYRRRWSYPYDYQDGPEVDRNHPRGPYVFLGDGSQQPMRKLIKNPVHGEKLIPEADVRVEGGDKTHPPHVSLGPFGHPPYRVKDSPAVCNYHRRKVKYMGRKIGRMTGLERQIYFATLSSLYYLRDPGYGIAMYPPWDPAGRLPINDVLYWDN